jgi:hypothetical protein
MFTIPPPFGDDAEHRPRRPRTLSLRTSRPRRSHAAPTHDCSKKQLHSWAACHWRRAGTVPGSARHFRGVLRSATPPRASRAAALRVQTAVRLVRAATLVKPSGLPRGVARPPWKLPQSRQRLQPFVRRRLPPSQPRLPCRPRRISTSLGAPAPCSLQVPHGRLPPEMHRWPTSCWHVAPRLL